MHGWRLSIAVATAPLTRLEAVRRLVARRSALLAALGALVLTLILGRSGAPIPHPLAASFVAAGLAAITGFGLLAWHFARLTVLPLAESPVAALIAALIPTLLLPGLGAQALIVPATVALWLAWRDSGQRVVALLVQCGAIAGAVQPSKGGFADSFICATMLGTALFLTLRALSGAANDNPSMERDGFNSKLLEMTGYASADSIPGKWGVE